MTVAQAVYDEYLRPASSQLDGNRLAPLLDACRQSSALGQKWTGSGGDGAFIALARDEDHQADLIKAIRAAGGSGLAITL